MITRHLPKVTEIATRGSTSVATKPSAKPSALRKFGFTKKLLDVLPLPTNGQRAYFYDAQSRGLAIAVTAGGRKNFVLYRKIAGRPERHTIGPYPDLSIDQARKEAARLNGLIAAGENPAAKRRTVRDEMTMGELASAYIEQRAKPHHRTWREDEGMVHRHLDGWKFRRISEITKSDVITLHSRIGTNSGPIAANRVMQLLRRIFNWAIDDRGWEGVNPANKVKCFREHSRERFLQPEEFHPFFKALEKEPQIWQDFFFLALWTGARRSNVQSMKWDEINFPAATWLIPGSKSKSGEPVKVVLELPAMDILRRRQKESSSEWVFPGDGKSAHLVEIKSAWKRICERAEIKDLHVHDLRRTLGSYQAVTGASLPIIGKSLGHRSIASTKPYAQLNLDPVRESVQKAIAAMMTAAERPAKLLGGGNG